MPVPSERSFFCVLVCPFIFFLNYLYWALKLFQIRVITKLPNSEQSYTGKVKTHKYINRQNQSTTRKLRKRNDPDLVQAFLKKWWVESDFKAPTLPLSLRLKVSNSVVCLCFSFLCTSVLWYWHQLHHDSYYTWWNFNLRMNESQIIWYNYGDEQLYMRWHSI